MPEYKCDVCKFVCKRPVQLKDHFNTTKHKANMYEQMPTSSPDTDVSFQKIMSYITELQMKVGILENKLKEKEDTIKSGICNKNSHCNITNNTIQNNINIHIQTFPFGRENWSYISDREMYHIMSGVNSCIPSMVEKLHFNVNHPENHNIRIQNKAKSEVKVFDGQIWRTQDKNATVDQLINKIRGRFDDYEDRFLAEATRGISFQWGNYWGDMTNSKKHKEMRKKVIGTIHDCQDIMRSSKHILQLPCNEERGHKDIRVNVSNEDSCD